MLSFYLNVSLSLAAIFAVLAIAEHILKRTAYYRVNIFYLVISAATLPLAAVALAAFAVYRQIVRAILVVTYGKRFAGLVNVSDGLYATKSSDKAMVCIVLIIKYDSRRPIGFYDAVKGAVAENMQRGLKNNPKAFGILQRWMGYTFFLSDNVTVDECVRKMPTARSSDGKIGKDDLPAVLNECVSQPLPRNHQVLWDVMVGVQPVSWKDDPDGHSMYYPVLIRHNHIVGDGIAVTQFLMKKFMDQTSKEEHAHSAAVNTKFDAARKAQPSCLNQLKLFLKQLYLIWVCFSKINIHAKIIKDQKNSLHGSKLRRERMVWFRVEDEPRFLKTIKKIKSKVQNCSTIDVILAAVGSSLSNYFAQQKSRGPTDITATVSEIPYSIVAFANAPSMLSNRKVRCENTAAFTVLQLPVLSDRTLEQKLNLTRERTSLFRKYDEIMVNYFIQSKLLGVLPDVALRLIMELMSITIIVSNIPGPPRFSVLDGCAVEDCFPILMHREDTGLSVSLTTYDERLAMTVNADKALISKEQVLQEIVDNIWSYVDSLSEELSKKY